MVVGVRQTQTVDLQTADLQACGLADTFGTHGDTVRGGGGDNCPRRDFAQKAKSRGGTLVTRVYIKESTYS